MNARTIQLTTGRVRAIGIKASRMFTGIEADGALKAHSFIIYVDWLCLRMVGGRF